MIATCKLVTPHSPNSHPLTLGHPKNFEESQVGSIWYEDGKVCCKGQDLKVEGKHYYDTVILAA